MGEGKERVNEKKHGVSFQQARKAFDDPNRVIVEDITHSVEERRVYCIGKIKEGVVTVRFTYRDETIRIFGAGFWRKERKLYEEKNTV